MIYVSMVEIFAQAKSLLDAELGVKTGPVVTGAAFFGGMLLIALIDKLIPLKGGAKKSGEFDGSPRALKELSGELAKKEKGGAPSKLLRSGLLTALALSIHNFPEGLATFMSALQDINIAIPIVFAIAVHNIPEGIAVSAPIYFATGSKKKAFGYSFLSGLTEPLGAVIGYFILMPFLNAAVMGAVFAAVAGIMVFISVDELLPSADEYGEHRWSVYGLVGGMVLMAVSLYIFVII